MTPASILSGPFEKVSTGCLHVGPWCSPSAQFGSHPESQPLRLHQVGTPHAAGTSTPFSPHSTTWQVPALWEGSLVILANIHWVLTKHFIPLIKPCEQRLLSSPFYSRGNCDIEKLTNLPKVTELVGGGAGI